MTELTTYCLKSNLDSKSKMLRQACFVLILLFLLQACSSEKKEAIYIYAAISTSTVLNDFEIRFEENHPQYDLKINYAATSTLARQIDAGAPADIFVSADTLWTRFLKNRKYPDEKTIRLAENRLVLVSSIKNGSGPTDVIADSKRLSVAELEHVPAGRHAKSILQCLELYQDVKDKLVPSMNVRVAFLNVKNEILESGIVYRSEAMNADQSDLEIYEIDEACAQTAIYELMILGKPNRRSSAELVVESLQSLQNKRLWEEKSFY